MSKSPGNSSSTSTAIAIPNYSYRQIYDLIENFKKINSQDAISPESLGNILQIVLGYPKEELYNHDDLWEIINDINRDLFQEISDRKAGDEGCRDYTDDSCQTLDHKIDTVQDVLKKDMQDLHDEMGQGDEWVEQRLGRRIDGALELIADCADAEITDGKFEAVNERLDNLSQEHEGDVQSLDRKIDTVTAVLGKGITDGDEAVRTELTARINSLSGASSASSRDISRLEVWPFAKVVGENDDIVKNPEGVWLKHGLAVGDVVYSELYRGFAAFTGNGFSADWGNEISMASDAVEDKVVTGGGSAGSSAETVKFTEAEYYGDVYPGGAERTCRRPARKSLYRLTDDNSLWLWDGSALRKVADVEALEALRLRLETLIGKGDVSDVIDTFNEIEAFLQGVTNAETLTGMLQDLQAAVLLETAKNYQPKGNYLTSHQSLDGLMNKDGSNATAAAVSTLINKLPEGYTTPEDNDWMLSQYAGGSKPDFLRRPFSKIWDYILTKDGSGSGLDADMLQGTKRHNGYNIFYKDVLTVQGTVGSAWYAEILMGNKWTSDFYVVLVYAPWNNIHGMLRIEKQGLDKYTYETNNYGGLNFMGINIRRADEGRLSVTLKLRACTAETDELRVYRPDGNTTLRKLDSEPDLTFSSLVHKCYSGIIKAPYFEGTAINIKAQQLTNEDLNDIKTQTFANFWGSASNTCKNKPAGVTIFNLTSKMVSSSFAHLLVDQNGTNWQRSFNGTDWTDWQQIATLSDLEPIKVRTDKLLAGATTARDWSKIPVTHKVVRGSLNGSDVTLNLAGSGAIPVGESIHCIIKNSHSAVSAVLSLTAFPRRNCETYIIQPGCYAEVNILYDGSEYYVRVI